MYKINVYRRFIAIVFLMIACLSVGTYLFILRPMFQMGHAKTSLNKKITSLQDRRPDGIDKEIWSEAVAWASIACCNIYYPDVATVRRWESELEEKMKGKVDLLTLRWIGERLAQSGPDGERYMSGWFEMWEDNIATKVKSGCQ